jgi:hypothetical protein
MDLSKLPHFQAVRFLANSALMSHRDPVSHKNAEALASQDEFPPGAGPGVQQKLALVAEKGSITGASETVIVLPPEIGGRDGPEPTRYGDWEKAGRCIDF